MMDNPELYVNENQALKADSKQFLEETKDLMPWLPGEKVLDVGCGPGDLTANMLPTFLADGYTIVGTDLSERMWKYAQENYSNDQISFKQMDICDENIFKEWEKSAYNKIFSLNCFHWVTDQRLALKNACELLKEDGYIVVTMLSYHPFLSLLENLPRGDKWRPYAEHYKPWNVIYDPDIDTKQEYWKILKQTGFDIIKFVEKDKSAVSPSREKFINYLEAIDPVLPKIPKGEKYDYLTDCLAWLRDHDQFEINEKKEISYKYKLLCVVAKKKLSLKVSISLC